MRQPQALRGELQAQLQQTAPFALLSWQDLCALMPQVTGLEMEADAILIEAGQHSGSWLFTLLSGRLEIWQPEQEGLVLQGFCEVGETLGLREALSESAFNYRVRAQSRVQIARVPAAHFLDLLERSPQALKQVLYAVVSSPNVLTSQMPGPESSAPGPLTTSYMRPEDVLAPQPITELVICSPETSVQAAAEAMRKRLFGSALVLNAQQHPVGIVTESDIVRQIVAAGRSGDTALSEIMSAPVSTLKAHATVAQIILKMTREQINHVVITADGTDQSPVQGIISEHDLLSMHGNHPAVLVKRLHTAESVKELSQIRNRADELIYNYLAQAIQVPFVAQIISEINESLIQRALEMSIAQLADAGRSLPSVPFCWLALGSEGRQEQLLRSDQDNAILFADVPAAELAPVKAYFEELGARVVQILIQCGFQPCKGDVMARNPQWVQPMRVWTRYFKSWIQSSDPEALRKISIFFDFHCVWGEAELSQKLRANIYTALEGQQRFLHLLVASALQHPPPRGFLGQFVVESSGENKHLFDLKARGLRPLDHAARVLSLTHRLEGSNNTFARYAQLADKLSDSSLFHEAAMAYGILMRHRALNGLQHGDNGRYLAVQELNHIEKQSLKTCFVVIERLQKYLRLSYGLRLN